MKYVFIATGCHDDSNQCWLEKANIESYFLCKALVVVNYVERGEPMHCTERCGSPE
jgi:hypothetical protein